MTIDIPLILSFVYIFVISNIYGWGLQHDKRYIAFSITLGIIYLLSHILSYIGKQALTVKIKIFLLFLFLGISVFLTTFSFIELRQKTSVSGFINDSALQTEIAGRYLLLGKNPYVENYVNTDLAKWPYKDEAGKTLNPALYANVTPPFMITLSALGFRVFSRLTGWFDIRFFLLISYLALILLGIVKFGFKENLLLFITLVCLQPIFLMSMMQGSNDIVVVSLLLWGLYFLERKNLLLSAILLGLSVAAKQTAWFIIPFYLIYLLQHYKRKQLITFLFPYIIVIALFYLPFVLWNFPALINNLIFYTSYSPYQNLPVHPIEGYGFSFLLYSLGVVRSIYSQYPFWIYQALIGFSFLLFFLKLQLKKRMNIAFVLYGSTTLIAIVWFFNRYFLVSHIGYILLMLGASYIWTLKTKKLEN